jgi:hypothetical protein
MLTSHDNARLLVVHRSVVVDLARDDAQKASKELDILILFLRACTENTTCQRI